MNNLLYTVLSVFIVLYAGLAVPKLPVSASAFLQRDEVRIFLLMAVSFISTRDMSTAMVVAVGYLFAATMLSHKQMREDLDEHVKRHVR